MKKIIRGTKMPPLRWYSPCGTYTVRLRPKCLFQMLALAGKHAPIEVGTSLVGSYSANGRWATILSLAPLPPDSRGTRSSFYRGKKGQREFFETVFQQSAGSRHYAGEWHSHPRSAPSTSPRDDWTQMDIAGDKTTDCAEAILIVLGGDFPRDPKLSVQVRSRETRAGDPATLSCRRNSDSQQRFQNAELPDQTGLKSWRFTACLQIIVRQLVEVVQIPSADGFCFGLLGTTQNQRIVDLAADPLTFLHRTGNDMLAAGFGLLQNSRELIRADSPSGDGCLVESRT